MNVVESRDSQSWDGMSDADADGEVEIVKTFQWFEEGTWRQ